MKKPASPRSWRFSLVATVRELLVMHDFAATAHVEGAAFFAAPQSARRWRDIDFAKRQLTVARSEWKGHVTMPKGGRIRYVPMTRRLTEALREARHLRGPRVLCDGAGKPLTQKVVQVLVRRTARRANVKPGIHILRHSFCSHLAMRGAPARAIQELAGHQDLGTTQRYMHLSPAALDAAIRLLETGTDTSRVAVEK
jgi:integrase